MNIIFVSLLLIFLTILQYLIYERQLNVLLLPTLLYSSYIFVFPIFVLVAFLLMQYIYRYFIITILLPPYFDMYPNNV